MGSTERLKLSHRVIAHAQVGLSYFFIAGFLAAIAAEGAGYLKAGTAQTLREGALLILFFWFQRQRSSEDTPAAPLTTPVLTHAPLPAPSGGK